jgi:hypothetical protein
MYRHADGARDFRSIDKCPQWAFPDRIAHCGHFSDFGGVLLGLTRSFTLTHGAIMHYETKAAYKQAARAMRKANAIARKRSADRLGWANESLAMFYAPLTLREMARDAMHDFDGARYLHLGQVASELARVAKGTA